MSKRITSLIQRNSFLTDLLMMTCLLLAGWRYTSNFAHVIDLSLYDETSYLVAGVTLLQQGLPDPAWGPLYAVWYFLQSFWHTNYIQLHDGNAILLTTTTPLLLYWTLRRYHLPIVAAGLFAYLFLLCHANLAVWPKSNNFALLVVICTFLLATLPKTADGQLVVLTIGALVSAYARPELFLTFLLLVVIYGGRLLFNPRQHMGQRLLMCALMALIASVLFVWIGVPFGGRSMVAFGQFYAVNWIRWTGSNLSPWTDWQEIVHQSFGAVDSVGAAARSNPAAFLRHITENAIQIPAKFVGLLIVHAPFFQSNQWKEREAYLLLASFLSFLLFGIRQWPTQLRQNLFPFRILCAAVGCYIVPALLSAIIVAPRSNYLLISATLFGSLALLLLFARPPSAAIPDQRLHQQPAWIAYTTPLFALVLVGVTPPTPGWFRETLVTPNRAVVNTLATLPFQSEVYLLEIDGGYGTYVDTPIHWVSSADKVTSFNTFAQTERINAIVLSKALLQDSRLSQDPEWQAFLENFASQGYTKLAVPKTDRAILIANQLLANRS